MNKYSDTLKLLSLPFGLLFLSFLGFLEVKSNYVKESTRIPANILPDETKVSQKTESPKELKKPHGGINVKVTSNGPNPLKEGQTTELTGTVKVNREIALVNVVWHLPAGVEQVAGDKAQSFANMTEGETRNFAITVTSHSNLNQQIHLEASYLQGDLKIGNTIQFNTIEPKKLNASVDEEGTKIWQ